MTSNPNVSLKEFVTPNAGAEAFLSCRICGNFENNIPFVVSEMMFGIGDEFRYFECSGCGCLQIESVPSDISRYYPAAYYSYAAHSRPEGRLRRAAQAARCKYVVSGRGFIGRFLFNHYYDPKIASLRGVALTRKSRILDVGCGSGLLLRQLRNAGFVNASGIDPYIVEDVKYAGSVLVRKQSIHNAIGNWDLILFHHSLEHALDPLETLKSAARLLSPKGTCLVRTPVASSYAWRHYRENWVQLDAPRHFFIQSLNSMSLLAGKAGFQVQKVIFDSSELQFWASEQYKKNIPLLSPESYGTSPSKSLFSRREIRSFRERAQELNAQELGDQAAFYLIHARPLKPDSEVA
jgi:2-polyprenyl-3-methyl-5-hydroxy-6-metoxy-1,4-benzoquinol methylase